MITLTDVVRTLNCGSDRLEPLAHGYKFCLDPLLKTPVYKNQPYIQIGFLDSILEDQTWLLHSTTQNRKFSTAYKNLIRYCNEKLFTEMIYAVINNKYDSQTHFVKRRIIISQMRGNCILLGFTRVQSLEWIDHFNDVYYVRARALANYRLVEIEKLPF